MEGVDVGQKRVSELRFAGDFIRMVCLEHRRGLQNKSIDVAMRFSRKCRLLRDIEKCAVSICHDKKLEKTNVLYRMLHTHPWPAV